MKIFRFIRLALLAILLCLSACSSRGDDPIEPTPKPEVSKQMAYLSTPQLQKKVSHLQPLRIGPYQLPKLEAESNGAKHPQQVAARVQQT